MKIVFNRFCVPFFGVVLCSLAAAPVVYAQVLKPETLQAFECYAQSAEGRMQARTAFLLADSDKNLADQLVKGQRVQSVAGNGVNPHKAPGGMIYDWIASIYIPNTTLTRTIRMLQDYDHRAQYFPEVISTSKLLCRTGLDHFRFTMRLKEPAVIDSDNDVVWVRPDAKRAQCRSYSTDVREIGKDHRYLLRLYSYWRFREADNGVFVEGQTITLSGEFGSLTRALGSMVGISPEKSLKKSLQSMRETLHKPNLNFPEASSSVPSCPAPFQAAGCANLSSR